MESTTSAASSKDPEEGQQQQQQQQSSILSRSTLYAPLVAYNQTRVPPADYLQTLNSLPKNVTEKALTSFLESTSVHFHLSQESLHGKNTAARPMAENEYKDRLLQKGLTLVGGGFYRAASNNKKRSLGSGGGRTKGRRRKRRKPVKTTKEDEEQIPDSVWKDQMQFLDNLNRKWNAYAWSMLLLSSSPNDEITALSSSLSSSTIQAQPSKMMLSLISKRAKLLSRTIEWAGAKVRLDRCASSSCPRRWEGCQGILLGETTRTWEVLLDDTTRNQQQQQRGEARTLIVPKQESSLTVLLPMPQESVSKENSLDASLSTNYLCLVLEDYRTKSNR